MQVKLLAPRTLGLFGPVLAEDADQLLDAIASVGPGGPISLNLTGVTSIDEDAALHPRPRAFLRTTSPREGARARDDPAIAA